MATLMASIGCSKTRFRSPEVVVRSQVMNTCNPCHICFYKSFIFAAILSLQAAERGGMRLKTLSESRGFNIKGIFQGSDSKFSSIVSPFTMTTTSLGRD